MMKSHFSLFRTRKEVHALGQRNRVDFSASLHSYIDFLALVCFFIIPDGLYKVVKALFSQLQSEGVSTTPKVMKNDTQT